MTGQPRHRFRFARLLLVLGLLLLAAAGSARAAEGSPVEVLTATGVVDGAMAGYLSDGVAAAARAGAPAVVVRLDTPGGSAAAMDEIKQAFLAAPVPVIVWVAPSGARAASAGTVITLAAHLAYMAPATNIGAAAPVAVSGGDIPGTMGVKVREDAIAAIAALAEARGRPVDWAVSTVAEARSYPASQALAAGAIDGIAGTLDEVLRDADGRTVTLPGGPVTLALGGAPVREAPMNPLLALLHVLSDPNIAFLLFVVGALGVASELIQPNLVGGIAGSLALVLAFIGFGSLPLNVVGLVLLGFAFVLFVLETQIVSHGLLTAAGLACFVLGASALYSAPSIPGEPSVAVAPVVLALTTATLGACMVLITIVAIRTRHMRGPREQLGEPVSSGTVGVVQAALDPIGSVHLAGETWSARTADERPLPRATPVRVVAFEGLTAIVEPVEPAPGDAAASADPTDPHPDPATATPAARP